MKYQDLNDYELLYLIKENDEDAYSCILKKYDPLIKKFAKEIFHKFSFVGIEYEDLYQEGLMGLLEASKNYLNSDTSFFTFAYLCIKREMVRLITKAIRNKNNILNRAVSINSNFDGSTVSLDEVLFNKKEITENVYVDIASEKQLIDLKYELKDKYMPIYELKINGFSNGDISTLLDLPYKNVDNYWMSIKTSLKKIKKNIIE